MMHAMQKTGAIFKNKSKSGKIVLKGIAFPVCLSVNEVVCHCSPLESDETVSLFSPVTRSTRLSIDLEHHGARDSQSLHGHSWIAE